MTISFRAEEYHDAAFHCPWLSDLSSWWNLGRNGTKRNVAEGELVYPILGRGARRGSRDFDSRISIERLVSGRGSDHGSRRAGGGQGLSRSLYRDELALHPGHDLSSIRGLLEYHDATGKPVSTLLVVSHGI